MRLPYTVLTVVCTVLFASGAERLDLNGEWQLRLEEPGAVVETVRVPHTWNIGKHADFEGLARYAKSFGMPAGGPGKHVELHFDATFYKSRVFLNGTEIGGHEGGHTAYWFDITDKLKAQNTVEVEIDNRPGMATIPGFAMSLRAADNVWYDWWHYGGIVRDVYLTVSDPVLVRRQQIRSKVTAGAAQLTDRVFVENFAPATRNVEVLVEVISPDGNPVASGRQGLAAAEGKSEVEVSVRVENPRLWHFDRPEVYQVRTSIAGGESITDNYGFRTVEIRDRKLFLNGEHVRLSGMTRHEESPWEGLAETPGTMKRDYDELKELQVTLTRPVHYPQHPYILDYADRSGILLIPEIPMWQFSEQQMQDPKVIALAKQMMTEMIEQAYNHPAILGWSVCNESEANRPGGKRYVEIMYEMVKKLDPDRYVTLADNHIAYGTDAKTNGSSIVDFVMMNEYFGTWGGPAEGLVPNLDKVRTDYPDKMVIISEFGAAGTFARDKKDGDELRRKIMREQLEIFRKYDFIGGAIFWCYQDYKSHRNLRAGERSGMVEMGVVDENRQRYPSYFLWQQENSPAAVDLQWNYSGYNPTGFRAVVSRRSEDYIPSYELRGYRAEWDLRDFAGALIWSGSKELANMGPPQTIAEQWPTARKTGYSLRFRVVRPTGFTAFERTLNWQQDMSGGDSVQDMQKRGYPVP